MSNTSQDTGGRSQGCGSVLEHWPRAPQALDANPNRKKKKNAKAAKWQGSPTVGAGCQPPADLGDTAGLWGDFRQVPGPALLSALHGLVPTSLPTLYLMKSGLDAWGPLPAAALGFPL